MQKTMTIEVSKINNKEKENNMFEWTKTFKIDYESSNKKTISNEENEMIKQEIEYRNNQLKKNEVKESTLINTQILSMDGNPFHQPSMNTFEFNIGNDVVVQVKNDEQTPLSYEEKFIALDKLFSEKIISKDEYEMQKEQLNNLKNSQ